MSFEIIHYSAKALSFVLLYLSANVEAEIHFIYHLGSSVYHFLLLSIENGTRCEYIVHKCQEFTNRLVCFFSP